MPFGVLRRASPSSRPLMRRSCGQRPETEVTTVTELSKRSEAALRQYARPEEDMNEALARLFREAGYEWRDLSLSVTVNRETKYWTVFEALPVDESFTLSHVVCAMKADYADRACGRGPVGMIDLDPLENDRDGLRRLLYDLEEKGLVERTGTNQYDKQQWEVTTLGLKTLDQHEQHQRQPLES